MISDEALDYLIQEVEQSIKNIKRFIEWCVGIIVTLVVLVSTLVLNIYSKFSDIVLKGIDDQDIKETANVIILALNKGKYDLPSDILTIFFEFLFLFSSFIFFGYIVFSLFSLVKRQVLITLYDIRYVRASNDFNELVDTDESK